MYSRKIPDSHRLIGGRSHVFYFDFKSLGTWLFGATVKVFGTSHTSGWIWYYIPGIQRSRTPFVFEICVIPLKPVLITGSDESWHTLCVHLLNICLCIPLHTPRLFAQQRSKPKCTIIVSQLVAFYPMFFQYFFVGRDPQMYTVGSHHVSIWAPSRLLYHNWLPIRSRQPIRSRFGHRPRYYTTLDFWSGLAHPRRCQE